MLGTIEELEKEIEEFQNNMAASGELTLLLRQTIDLIKAQNSSFETESGALLSKLDALPGTIEQENASSNETIRKNVDDAMQRTVDAFSQEQNRYVSTLEKVENQISAEQKQYVETLKAVDAKLDKCQGELVSKYEEFLKTLEDTNLANLRAETQMLRSDLNKKTTVLTVISVISVLIGIAGFFF